MEENVQKSELVYRAVKRSKPNWLDQGNATPAMFKDIGGNSVDRDGKRSREEVIEFMNSITFPKRLKGVVELRAGECMDTGVEIIPDPKVYNPYHANIFLSENEDEANLQALMMADMGSLIYFNSEMQWVRC